MTLRTISLSALAVCLCVASQCAAQDFSVWIAPTIRLSSEETASAKQATEELKKAEDRATNALANWNSFEKEFAQVHPEVAWPKFSSDFTAAYSVHNQNTDAPMATVVKLSAEEHQKAEAVYTELKASYDARQQAERNWSDFQGEFLVKHAPGASKVSAIPSGQLGVTLPNGETYTVPAPWGFGIALTPDFRTAVPRTI